MYIPAYIKKIFISVILILSAFNLIKTSIKVIESSKRLEDLEQEVAYLESKKVSLEEEKEHKKTRDFIIAEARNKLGFIRPGEELFVLSSVLGSKTSSINDGERSNLKGNPGLWLDLFL